MAVRSPALKAVLDRNVRKLSSQGLRAEATWLPSIANARADKLSRENDSLAWRLHSGVFAILT